MELTSKLIIHLLPLLCLGLGIGHLDRSNIAFAQLQMGAELGLTHSDFAVCSGIFFLAYATFQVPCAHLAGRIGPRLVLGWCLVFQGLVAAGQSLVTGGSQLAALRLLLGLPEAAYYPSATLYVSLWFPDASRARAAAVFQAFAGLGVVLGNLSAGPIMQQLDGAAGAAGWRWLFASQGLPAVVLGALTLLWLPDRPADAAFLSDGERAELLLQLASSDTAAAGKPLPLGRALVEVLRRGLTWTHAALSFSLCTLMYMNMFFLPTMLKELRPGWPLATIGLLGAIPPLLSLLSAPAVGAWADRTSAHDRRGRARRLGAAWGCNAANGLGVLGAGLCLWAASDAAHARGGAAEARGFSVGALVVLILAFPLGTATMGPFWALHHSAQPAPLHAVSIATINSIGNLGGFVGPYLLAALRDWLGPDCPPGREGTCVSQWAFGTIGVSLGALAVVAASGAAAARLLLSAHAGGVGGGRAAADGGGVARRASPPGMPLLAVDGGAAAVRQSYAGGEPATPADEADDGVPLWVVPASKERLAGEGGR